MRKILALHFHLNKYKRKKEKTFLFTESGQNSKFHVFSSNSDQMTKTNEKVLSYRHWAKKKTNWTCNRFLSEEGGASYNHPLSEWISPFFLMPRTNFFLRERNCPFFATKKKTCNFTSKNPVFFATRWGKARNFSQKPETEIMVSESLKQKKMSLSKWKVFRTGKKTQFENQTKCDWECCADWE